MISFASAGDNPLWHCVCAEMEAPVEGSWPGARRQGVGQDAKLSRRIYFEHCSHDRYFWNLLACCVRLLFCSVTCCFVCAGPWGVLCNLLIAFYKSRGNSFQKKASDEPMSVPSVHPMVHFDSNGHRTHLTHLEMRASDHLTLWTWFQLVQFSTFKFSVDSFASTLLPWTLWGSWQPRNLSVHNFMAFECMVKLLVYEPLLIVHSNTTS
jgi:hypothetical protein